MSAPTKCPKCEGKMQEGFTLDSDFNADFRVSRWVAGKPETSFWTRTKISNKTQHPIRSFRCTECGYLESYAIAD